MNSKHVYKWFFVWDYEEEEKWLNEMALSGWVLNKVGFCSYTFISCQPGEYEVRLTYPEHKEEFIEFTCSTGAEYIGNMVYWLYFRKKTNEGEFRLLSDIDSKVSLLKRIEKILLVVMLMNAVMSVSIRFGSINAFCAMFLAYGLGRIRGMRAYLQKEREIHE